MTMINQRSKEKVSIELFHDSQPFFMLFSSLSSSLSFFLLPPPPPHPMPLSLLLTPPPLYHAGRQGELLKDTLLQFFFLHKVDERAKRIQLQRRKKMEYKSEGKDNRTGHRAFPLPHQLGPLDPGGDQFQTEKI